MQHTHKKRWMSTDFTQSFKILQPWKRSLTRCCPVEMGMKMCSQINGCWDRSSKVLFWAGPCPKANRWTLPTGASLGCFYLGHCRFFSDERWMFPKPIQWNYSFLNFYVLPGVAEHDSHERKHSSTRHWIDALVWDDDSVELFQTFV